MSPNSVFFENAAIFIASLYQQEGEKAKAIQHLETVIQQHPENPDFYIYLGHFYEEQKQYEKAETVLKDGLKINLGNYCNSKLVLFVLNESDILSI